MSKSIHLYRSTVSPLLEKYLLQLMSEPLFLPFRLVGGTNLSLREGHRISEDIDLFTDAEYDSLDFSKFEKFLQNNFKYFYSTDKTNITSFGRPYYIGESEDRCLKLDLFYTDPFIKPVEIYHGIRFASLEDIAAMKLEAVNTGARKKDFWDIHVLLQKYTFEELLNFYQQRYPYNATTHELCEKMVDFKDIDGDFNPRCLLGKDWDMIKLDIIDVVMNYMNNSESNDTKPTV